MNLEDYAYNEGDRWYIDPQVSLDEQNAFINNLRGLQAQDNAQIERQTRALGTQVPSQLGGLVGAGSYFRSRYQTPQTNQTVANLRTVAQAKALETAISNEIAKKQKQYKDAYRAAQERESNKSNTNTSTPLYDQLHLNVNSSGTTPSNEIEPSVDEVKRGEIGVDENGTMYFEDWAGRKYAVSRPSQMEGIWIDGERPNSVIAPKIGDVVESHGNTYIYTGDGWLRIDGLYDANLSDALGKIKEQERTRNQSQDDGSSVYTSERLPGETDEEWVSRMIQNGDTEGVRAYMIAHGLLTSGR